MSPVRCKLHFHCSEFLNVRCWYKCPNQKKNIKNITLKITEGGSDIHRGNIKQCCRYIFLLHNRLEILKEITCAAFVLQLLHSFRLNKKDSPLTKGFSNFALLLRPLNHREESKVLSQERCLLAGAERAAKTSFFFLPESIFSLLVECGSGAFLFDPTL